MFTGTLRPYQAAGAGWLLSQKRTLLADEMGLGKTVQAIGALAGAEGPCLIVPPPHIVRQWEAQLDAFLSVGRVGRQADLLDGAGGGALRRHTIRGLKPLCAAGRGRYHRLPLSAPCRPPARADAARAAYRRLRRGAGDAARRHREILSGARARRTAHYCWGLRGTPIYNRGGEIWNVSNIIEMHCLGDWDSFTREWCGGYGSDTVADPERLGAHLRREGLLLRRRKQEVMADLPPKHGSCRRSTPTNPPITG